MVKLKGATLNKVEIESVMFWLSGSYEAPQEEEAEPEWSEWPELGPEAWWTPEEELACEEPAQEIEQSDADNVLTEAKAQNMFFTGKGAYEQARSPIAAQRTSR
eukprot:339054-Amphidinium_carterae.1